MSARKAWVYAIFFACDGKPPLDGRQDSDPASEGDADTDADADSDTDSDADSDITFDTALPDTGPWRQVSVGDFHACGIRADGTLRCWGDNQNGQCDNPPGIYIRVGLDVQSTCAILDGGIVSCWGSLESRDFPGGSYVAVDSYWGSYCALRDDGAIDCWGRADTLPVPTEGTYSQIAVGSHKLCALGDAGGPDLTCWGLPDWWGYPENGPFLDACVGETFGCVLDADRELVCFGNDVLDFLNNAERLSEIAALGPFLDISCVDNVIALIDRYGQIRAFPTQYNTVPDDAEGPFVRADVGPGGVCGLGRDGTISCWGSGGIPDVPE